MEIREIGAGGVVIIGGAIFGFTQMGLNDALSEELRHITEVTQQERPNYMNQVVAEFTETFEVYGVETDSYAYVGRSKFSKAAATGTFIEVVTQDTPVPKRELKGIRDKIKNADFCAQDEMTMFTDNGWAYKFSLTDSGGQKIFSIVCTAIPQLRTS